jgi:putative restriction endonuclease
LEYKTISQELEDRKVMWKRLLERGGPNEISPDVLRALGIYGGAQGIWVDKARTSTLTQDGYGVTVSLTHSGKSYPDDWSTDGVIYHYPDTRRPQGRDTSEIEATKNAGRCGIPVFVITHTSHSKRDVYIGWVTGWDDTSKQFLVLFDNSFQLSSTAAIQILEEISNENPFALFQQERGSKHTVIGRKSQQRFKFQVVKRYGPTCAVCQIGVLSLLQAAHLVPKEHKGSDDPRNGLVLCANHHLAFDTNLFAIHPKTLELCYNASGPDASRLQISAKTLHHLSNHPHEDALTWRYNHWVQCNHEKA